MITRSRPLAALLLIASCLVVTVAEAQQLPTHPEVVQGRLQNGLRYLVLPHDNPPERAALYMHVSTGSLNETDEQRGIAHFLEHMAFNGSQNFQKNEVIEFFESLGLTFGRHQNAFTSFDQTTYTLEMPDNEPETLGKASLLFFSDVALRLSLDPQEIENERGVILEEQRSRLSPSQRVQEYIFERIAPGSTFGQRLPIGVEETILGVDREDFLDYYGRWYTPSNIVLMVAADMDPAVVVEQIEAHFGSGRVVAQPVDQPAGVEPYTTSRAIVATDEEITQASVSIVRLAAPAPPTLTESDLRKRLVENLGSAALNRRLRRKVEEGTMSFLTGSASTGDLFNAFRFISVGAGGDPDVWRDMLRDVATELQRARLHGFTSRELEDVRDELVAGSERAVEMEDTMPARALLSQMLSAVAGEEPYMSAAQRLETLQRQLPTIGLEEVSQRFAAVYDPSAVSFIVELPADADVPTEAELLALGKAALDVSPEADVEGERPTAFMTELPEPGRILEAVKHEDSGVESAWLANNVRVHYRFMDYRKDTVSVSITLAGGGLLETPGEHGLTQMAGLAWGRPATSTLRATDVRDLMVGKKVQVAGGAGQDRLSLDVSGSPEDLETGLQLAHLLLTDPVIEETVVKQWTEQQSQRIASRKLDPRGAFGEAFTDLIFPAGERRPRPLELDDLERLDRARAQERLLQLVQESPMEVAVVGDIDRDKAFELVARYLGSLPSRPRISETTYQAIRRVERPVGPLSSSRSIKTQTPVAVVQSGFFGADWSSVEDRRLLQMAAQILSSRMIKEIREARQLVYSIGTQAVPGFTFPGYGMVFAVSPTEPAKVDQLLAAIDDTYRAFAETGPTEEEMEVARKQVANTLDEQMKEPRFWGSILVDLDFRGTSLDNVMNAGEAYQGFTAGQVRSAFARYFQDESRFSVVVAPE